MLMSVNSWQASHVCLVVGPVGLCEGRRFVAIAKACHPALCPRPSIWPMGIYGVGPRALGD
jgi:hypothetical protein